MEEILALEPNSYEEFSPPGGKESERERVAAESARTECGNKEARPCHLRFCKNRMLDERQWSAGAVAISAVLKRSEAPLNIIVRLMIEWRRRDR
jgi:hypothetical protein